MSHPMIELRNLHRTFGSTRAVNDISFSVPKGHVFGYIGPNGAGKTTSMRILATLDQPTAGDAYIDGFSVVNDPDRVRYRLGFMPDYFGTYANVNVREYLDFFARAYGLRGKDRTRSLSYVMSFTKLDTLAEKPISGLSKGMKQRLCLGRALIHNPAVLVLDEPAAGLDPRARIQLREMIRALAAHGKTVLISSHILTELAEMCDTVGIIELGRLLAVGSVNDIQKTQQHQARVQTQILGGAAALGEWLSARDGVHSVEISGESAIFLHDGDRQAEVLLLKEMVQAGFAVAAFGSQDKSLEEVFLDVTRGHVQ
ncbi:MAG: ABC transporter ATP-binding protein [Planctomycetia bacterium]|nr:ABC transporter ATP-binding protein [Planctomycetia bacterium]